MRLTLPKLVGTVVGIALLVPLSASAARTIRSNADQSWGVTHLGDWNLKQDASYHAAVKHLGPPSSIDNPASTTCTGRWSNLGLEILFTSFGGGMSCADSYAQKAKIRGHRDKWRTQRGLRIGDSAEKLKNRYPNAWKHGPNWWLAYQRHSMIGTGPHSIVVAKVRGQEVTKFRLWLGGAGD
jgi:hypothetical protein